MLLVIRVRYLSSSACLFLKNTSVYVLRQIMPSPTEGPITEQPCARLCVVKQWPDFQGFGFNLTSKSGRPGHFVECIDSESPAAYAGLKNSDKIIEVNSEVITSYPHAQVSSFANYHSIKLDMLFHFLGCRTN